LKRLSRANPEIASLIGQVRKDKLTYLDLSALIDLYHSVAQLEKDQRAGLIVEAGCALGGSAIVIAGSKNPSRSFYLYDVFGTIPAPSEQDGIDAHERYGVISSGKSEGINGEEYYGYQEDLFDKVIDNFTKSGFPIDKNRIYLKKGLFQDALFIDEPVALAHIDADWYESVIICLERITPYLVKGGVLIIDDYYHWSGARKAVDQFFEGRDNEFQFINKSRLHVVKK
jgi:asparagine synthase (glutamine-hydrolysing)